MDYLYENLGDERFQEFCSCLVSKEFPDVQVYPIGQPDGGRDSLSYIMHNTKKDFIVFQVKFVRNPSKETETFEYLSGIIKKEAPKVEKLIKKGAKKYYLLTNLRSSGHLDVGTKDKINKLLEETIGIPSICWWREDLSILFEKDPLFKWSYPELLNGQDVLNSLIFNNIRENREKRELITRAYLIDQYAMDNEVKFRQIELQNGLYDLFIDVPIKIKKSCVDKEFLNILYHEFREESDELIYSKEDAIVYAAEFLLHPYVQNNINQLLLEGGPGQGKSTVCQYISQVHRSRLLNKTSEVVLFPDNIRNSPVRLPFKIDLRHIASWIENNNPYSSILNETIYRNIWHKSLESFMVGHIIYHSRLTDFISSDFIAICKESPVLFIFDGLDEIGNLDIRGQIIDFINEGINRISINAKSVQVIITSRPAVFSDTLGNSEDKYPHFELTNITPSNTNDYVQKWIKASKLNDREASEIKRLVKEKLKLPHIKELAKSPMQLAIFVSLLRTDGESLPNKRTALYDSYIRLFFNRESEKNSLIRERRDLIIEIHEYIAWILHSEAELFNNNGAIHIDELKKRLNQYLEAEGHMTDITDKLFQVVKERVCALVSRVQGTFEFEVQPLREYFCAKFLYKTKPYSPAGVEKSGTLPDRFDAVARNFYWQNVVRFFAGCFDKGELSMLKQKLEELVNDDRLKYTSYPLVLTAQLLSDYVFTQYPILLKNVIKIIIDGMNNGKIIDQNYRNENELIILPPECGRNELINECFKQLSTLPSKDFAIDLIDIIKNNPDKNVDRWLSYLSKYHSNQLSLWLEYGYSLNLFRETNETILEKIMKQLDLENASLLLTYLTYSERFDFIVKNPIYKEQIFTGILNNNIKFFRRNIDSYLDLLISFITPFFYLEVFDSTENNMSFIQNSFRIFDISEKKAFIEYEIEDKIDEKIKKFIINTRNEFEKDILNWRNDVLIWDKVIESGRQILGDFWIFSLFSNISAYINIEIDDIKEFNDLGDSTISKCKRACYARKKANDLSYWKERMGNQNDIEFVLLVFFSWASASTIISLLDTIIPLIESIDVKAHYQIIDGVKMLGMINKFSMEEQILIIDRINSGQIPDSKRLKHVLGTRFDEKKHEFFINYFDDQKSIYNEIDELRLDYLVKKFLFEPSNEEVLERIKGVYKNVNSTGMIRYDYYRYKENPDYTEMPYETAKKIKQSCREYPKRIVAVAEKTCRLNAIKSTQPVGEIAKKEGWLEKKL